MIRNELFSRARTVLRTKALEVRACVQQSKPPQLIISIPKRIVKLAVARNLIRRRIKHILRIHHPDQDGYDLIILVRSGIGSTSFEQLTATLSQAFFNANQQLKNS